MASREPDDNVDATQPAVSISPADASHCPLTNTPSPAHLELPASSGTSADSSASASSPTYTSLSLAMAGQVLGAVGATPDGAAVPATRERDTLPSSQLYSSPALPSDSKELAHPVLIAPGTGHDDAALYPMRNREAPALLGLDGAASHSASASPSAVSGSSTPARTAINELHLYAQQIQQQLLSQHIHHQLQGGRGPPSSTPPLHGFLHSQVASASASTYNSPPDSGRSSPNPGSSTRSHRAPYVLETRRLDIQTHTSGRRMVNQYLIEGELGRGVHGKVRLATDTETGERVAVKIVEREARKRLGAGLGLLNRNNRHKDPFRLSGPALDPLPLNSQSAEEAKATQEPARPQLDSDSPQDDAASASTTVKGFTSTPSTQFAPLPSVPRSPSALGLQSRWGSLEKDAERRREKEREKARKALLWTTDQKVRREIAIMKKCSHDNVVQLKEVIDDPQSKKIFMVLEYMEGGEIVWKDEQGNPTLTVDEARSILRDVVCGLEYLHYQGIIHRDIKPANLLWDKNHRVKISDFGVSHFSYAMMIASDRTATAASATPASSSASSSSSKLAHPSVSTSDPSLMDDRELAKTAGSPAFFAPELCMSTYPSSSPSIDPGTTSHAVHGNSPLTPARPKVTKAIDVWALGVTLYCLLFGTTPFTAESEYALFTVIPSTDYSIPTFMGSDRVRVGPRKPRWQSQSQWNDEEADAQPASPSELSPDVKDDVLSEDARRLRDLLDRLLEKDPDQRITLEEVKKHPWVTHGLQDAPAWLSETDPQHLPFVEVSHAEVEDALTGFSKLKQRVKRWQSKLLDSFSGGRRRSRSVNHSSAGSSIHTDAHTDSGNSSTLHGRLGGAENAVSTPVTPFDLSSQSGPPTFSVKTPRTPLKGHMFFSRQKSANSVGRRDGVTALRALTSSHRNDDTDSVASGSPQIKDTDGASKPGTSQTSPPHQTSPRAFEQNGAELHPRVSAFSPMLPPPVLVSGTERDSVKPPELAAHRRFSAQSTSSAGLRPDAGPEIPQRTSSDTHGAQRRVSATSTSPSLATASPQMPPFQRMASRQGSGSRDLSSQRAASPRRSIDCEEESATLSTSQNSRVSGRHRLGDFLRGSWLMTGEDRNRSSSRPSTRCSRDAPPFSSGVDGATRSKNSGSIRSTTSSIKPGSAGGDNLSPLSIDTRRAVQQTGARQESGTPTSAPVLGSNSSALSVDPSHRTEVLGERLEGVSIAHSSSSAASSSGSPLSSTDATQPFVFDQLGRRRHVGMPLNSVDVDEDDVDLELDLSDDDLSDDLHNPGGATDGPMLVNSGHGWTIGGGEHFNQSGASFLPEAYARKASNGSDSSNDLLTPSVEGGYNVFKPPYQHILSPPESSVTANCSGVTAATDLSEGDATHAVSKEHEAQGGAHADFGAAAPACQTFAMDASLSTQAEALRKAELTEPQTSSVDVSAVVAGVTPSAEVPTSNSSGSVSRAASHRQHGSDESSRAASAADTQITRSDSDSNHLASLEAKLSEGPEPVVATKTSLAPEDSQFADADEDAPALSTTNLVAAEPAMLNPSSAALEEDDEDSDEQCVSFQARRKRSTRFRTTPSTAA